MKLSVSSEGGTKGRAYYTVHPDFSEPDRGKAFDRLMNVLATPIDRMCHHVLGDNLIEVKRMEGAKMLRIVVPAGMSRDDKLKFKLRDLFGWINLFDEAPA